MEEFVISEKKFGFLKGLKEALSLAFKGGTVTGLLVVGLALLGVTVFYIIAENIFGAGSSEAVKSLIGLSFGASLISIFALLFHFTGKLRVKVCSRASRN